MMECVVAHDVPLGGHPAHQIRLPVQVIPGEEKGGRNLQFLQNIQHFSRESILIPGIEGQVQHLPPVPVHIRSPQLPEPLGGHRPSGGFPLILKGKPPAHHRLGTAAERQDQDPAENQPFQK